MTESYRVAELAKAEQQYAIARAMYEAQPFGSRKWRKAADDLEFWGNKTAFLSHVRGE